MNKYLMVVACIGFIGLLISLFLMADFLGPVKKITGLLMERLVGGR